MYKKKSVRKLGKPADQRKALLKSQVKDLIERGFIRTTKVRAKEVVKILGQLAHYAEEKNIKKLDEYLKNDLLVSRITKLNLSERKTGIATMIQIKNRPGDNAEQVLVELIKE